MASIAQRHGVLEIFRYGLCAVVKDQYALGPAHGGELAALHGVVAAQAVQPARSYRIVHTEHIAAQAVP